jgi:hypothetical protein
MALKFENRESSDWGFQIPPAGEHLIVWEDNIREHKNETSGKTSLMLPAKIVEGEGENMTFTVFAPLETKFGKKKLADIIVMSGLAPMFEKQFANDDIEPDHPKIIDALKAKLPGRTCKVTLEIAKDNQGREQVNPIKIAKSGKPAAAPKATAAPKAGEAAGSAAASEGDGW